MLRDSSKSEWLDLKLKSTRQRVNQLEIEACRIRTELAQIEVVNATGVLPEAGTTESDQAISTTAPEQSLEWHPAGEMTPDGMQILLGAIPANDEALDRNESVEGSSKNLQMSRSFVSSLATPARDAHGRATPPVLTSIFAHAAVMIFAVSISVVAIEGHHASMTTTLTLNDKSSSEAELNFDTHQLADLGETGTQNVSAEMPTLEAVGPSDHVPIPIELDAISSLNPPGEIGLSESQETDSSKLPAGAGGIATDGKGTGGAVNAGKTGAVAKPQHSGGRTEQTAFFGTAAKGNRFVFVVDNSSSMKGGRLERAVSELVRTVEGLSPRQSFYVIFVSDKTYPMFIVIPPPFSAAVAFGVCS